MLGEDYILQVSRCIYGFSLAGRYQRPATISTLLNNPTILTLTVFFASHLGGLS